MGSNFVNASKLLHQPKGERVINDHRVHPEGIRTDGKKSGYWCSRCKTRHGSGGAFEKTVCKGRS